MLRNHDATRNALIGAIRSHLGRAVAGDVALFWFSGHGGQEPVPQHYWQTEPSGYLQTLVCCDSRLAGPDGRRVPDLLDKELDLLLDEVAARGPHVAVVLDSCHAEGATRDPDVSVRGIGPAPDRLPMTSFLQSSAITCPCRGARSRTSGSPTSCSLPAASTSRPGSNRIDGQVRGASATKRCWARSRPSARPPTYRGLASYRRCNRRRTGDLRPVPDARPDRRRGASRPALPRRADHQADGVPAASGTGDREVDAGRRHGIPGSPPEDPMPSAVPFRGGLTRPAPELLRVTEVRATTLDRGTDRLGTGPGNDVSDRRREHADAHAARSGRRRAAR